MTTEDCKIFCEECGWRGTHDKLLLGKSPFEDAEIRGCPKCKAIESHHEACDEPGCWEHATCGTPTPTGYRRTCGKHIPKP